MIVAPPVAFAAAIKACAAVITLQGAFPVLQVGANPCPVQIDASGATVAAWTFYGSKHVTVTGGTVGKGAYFDALIYGADDITLDGGNYPAAKNAAISVYNSTNITLRRNVMRNSEGDCVDMSGSRGFVIEDNVCTDHAAGSVGIHPDGFQIWSPANLPQTADGIVRRNVVIGNFQGVTGFDHPTQGQKGFARITFSDNRIATDEPQCVALYDATDSVVTGNVCSTLFGAKFQPAINVVGGNVIQSGNTPGLRP